MILANNTVDVIFPILIISGFIIFGFSIYYFGRKQTVLRNLSKFQFKSIPQFKYNELTKITGKVLHVHEPFVAPFSKRKCVAYLFKIEQKVSSGKHSRWKALVKQEDIQDFFIEENGEVVMIKPVKVPKNYFNYLDEDKSISSGFLNDPTPEFKKVLDYYNIDSENYFGFNKTLRYSERIIEVGEIVTVAGIAKWKSLQEPIEGYNYSKIAALESNDNQKLIITDLPEARKSRKNY
ncbi:hypothetical protein [Seonamhaeicola aphaedonensis]|uniref:RING-type E3 ubiquitin transferase n=1 Tax=Seonamhaeicola aphaedonensis TaxID=1461338 RepID=A0A3D9H888_9FLAO|nr:hypothetical protein [Seonamhaeicola aphaedonensis]RED45698.1 hypothetical protein DFQ02_10876 [Seonamhaeicola aphaedonensis]